MNCMAPPEGEQSNKFLKRHGIISARFIIYVLRRELARVSFFSLVRSMQRSGSIVEVSLVRIMRGERIQAGGGHPGQFGVHRRNIRYQWSSRVHDRLTSKTGSCEEHNSDPLNTLVLPRIRGLSSRILAIRGWAMARN